MTHSQIRPVPRPGRALHPDIRLTALDATNGYADAAQIDVVGYLSPLSQQVLTIDPTIVIVFSSELHNLG